MLSSYLRLKLATHFSLCNSISMDILLIGWIKLNTKMVYTEVLYIGLYAVYVQEDIPSKLVLMQNFLSICFLIEFNLRSKKCFLSCSCDPHRSLISEHLSITGENLHLLSANYDNIFLTGDYYADSHDHYPKTFCNIYNIKNMIKVTACFKNPEGLTTIDVMFPFAPCTPLGRW